MSPGRRGSTPSSADRLAGALLGLALGDALGFVVEAAAPEVARTYADELSRRRVGARSHAQFPFGQYSDDTQLARALLLGVRDAGGWDPAAFARRVEQLFQAGAAVGAGPGTRGAAERLRAGVHWREAGAPAPYAGNGAAMRVAPVGILLGGDMARLVAVATEQALVTHLDPRCAGGAVAVAGAAALVGRPGELDARRVVREVVDLVATVDADMADVLAAVEGWLDLAPEQAIKQLRQTGLDPADGATWRGVSTHVVPSVAWSLYAALRSPDDYWTAVCTAIEVGGDTDTMAAMAGGIVGGRVGGHALPRELLVRLTDRGTWNADALEALACDCAAIRIGGSGSR